MSEVSAYHEAGHAFMAFYVGARVRSVTIEPDWDDGLPISVVDIDRAHEPFRVEVAPPDSEYVFNNAGQVIRLDGLLCLFDTDGPCGNAVKDSQRTKTGLETRRTLSLIWGTTALPNRAAAAEAWYHSLLIARDAIVRSVWP